MAYNRSQKFPQAQKCCMLLDPGAYQIGDPLKVTLNKVPFLSPTPRETAPVGSLWTHAIYDTNSLHKIPNCSSLRSKCPRFPYEAFNKEDLETLLCRCGINNECECPVEGEENQKGLCQGKVIKHIIIGPTPRYDTDAGLSVPANNDNGFVVLPDGSQKRLLDHKSVESPPFYLTNIFFSTDFYRGFKWSRWTEKRSMKSLESAPGPASYFCIKEPKEFELCAEKYREYKRLTSKELRFIDMVQARNILEGLPGPGSYNPEQPKGYKFKYLGPKAKRFRKSKFDQRPGPADYDIKRTFDFPKPPDALCHAKLPEKSFFGVKAQRFKQTHEEGPSPATYDKSFTPCHFMRCPAAPFGSSSKRFKENLLLNEAEDTIYEEGTQNMQFSSRRECRHSTWVFNSKTTRMKPLKKLPSEPSPADMPQKISNVHRSRRLQFLAPFWTSEGRFQPWKDWMPVHSSVKTPGPCHYEWGKPKCFSAVTRGPLQRSERFPYSRNAVPAPNKYKVASGIESVLNTHNFKLNENIKNQRQFHWEPPIEHKELSYEERERILLRKSIALLDIDDGDPKKEMVVDLGEIYEKTLVEEIGNRKLLRTFVYGQEMPHCI